MPRTSHLPEQLERRCVGLPGEPRFRRRLHRGGGRHRRRRRRKAPVSETDHAELQRMERLVSHAPPLPDPDAARMAGHAADIGGSVFGGGCAGCRRSPSFAPQSRRSRAQRLSRPTRQRDRPDHDRDGRSSLAPTIFYPFAQMSCFARGDVLMASVECESYAAAYYSPHDAKDAFYPVPRAADLSSGPSRTRAAVCRCSPSIETCRVRGRARLLRRPARPASLPRSSNRTCPIKASGFPTHSIVRHTAAVQLARGRDAARRGPRTLSRKGTVGRRALSPCAVERGTTGRGHGHDYRCPDTPPGGTHSRNRRTSRAEAGSVGPYFGPRAFVAGPRSSLIFVLIRERSSWTGSRPDTNGRPSIAVRAERVAKEVEALLASVPHRGFRLVERQPELRHHRLRPRQSLRRAAAAEDDEVVGIETTRARNASPRRLSRQCFRKRFM